MNQDSLIIDEARTVLVLLAVGKTEDASRAIEAVDIKLAKKNILAPHVDVLALWDQVKIAASNISDSKYFEQVKDELNRVTFEFTHENE